MSSNRHRILSAGVCVAIVLAAGAAMLAPTAPARPWMASAPTEARIATADTLLVLQALWEQPELDRARRDMAVQLNQALSAKQAEVTASESQLQESLRLNQARWAALPENDPERTVIERAFETQQMFHNQRVEAYDTLRMEAQERVDAQRAGQLRDCYARLRAAVGVIAQREGYSHVIAHASYDAQLETFGFDGVLQGIRDRPVVFAPGGTDLTEALLAELGVGRPTFGAGRVDPAGPGMPEP